MSEKSFEKLLQAMPNIAKAVNTFTSDSVQQKAFSILMDSFGVVVEIEEPDDEVHDKSKPKKTSTQPRVSKGSKQRKAQSGPPKLKADLNLRPKGKKSLKEFVAEKKPQTNEERFAVIIYYLQKTLGEKAIGRDHVHTGFKELGVKAPIQIDAALGMAANRKGWINTSGGSDLKMTVHGENFVEHDLPRLNGGKK